MRHEGWAVEIYRDDGTSFMACAGAGILPVVWALSQRRYAVRQKRELLEHGLKAKVVRVAYHDVVVIRERKGK